MQNQKKDDSRRDFRGCEEEGRELGRKLAGFYSITEGTRIRRFSEIAALFIEVSWFDIRAHWPQATRLKLASGSLSDWIAKSLLTIGCRIQKEAAEPLGSRHEARGEGSGF